MSVSVCKRIFAAVLTVVVLLCFASCAAVDSVLNFLGLGEHVMSGGEARIKLAELMPDFPSRFYVFRLGSEEIVDFYSIYAAALDHVETVKLPCPISAEQYDKLFLALYYDCPELIHLRSDGAQYTLLDGKVVSVELPYCIDASSYPSAKEATEARVAEIVAAAKGKADAYEQEEIVYTMLTENCRYDLEYGLGGSPYGALVQKTARCEGISRAFTLIMRKLGAEVFCMLGKDIGTGVAHAWNVLRLGDTYYDVDPTSDVIPSGETQPRYAYYGLNRAGTEFRTQFTIDETTMRADEYPIGDSEADNYYARHGLLFSSFEDAEAEFFHTLTGVADAGGTEGTAVFRFANADAYVSFRDGLQDSINRWSNAHETSVSLSTESVENEKILCLHFTLK